MLLKGTSLEGPHIFEELTCNTSRDYQFFEGTGNMFCEPSICQHQGMLKGTSAGCTFVTNPRDAASAQKRPAFLSMLFHKIIMFVNLAKPRLESVEDASSQLRAAVSDYHNRRNKIIG
jgi:hypothetical protein